jgi:hydrogenase nickel incorporation protein HypA/HybF
MHELSIAQAVADIASRHAAGRPVSKVEVKIGHLRQVVPSALEFAFELVTEGTVLAGAELVIKDVPACGSCRSCGTRTVMRAFPLQCSHCGGVDLELEAGEELLVDALELETEPLELAGQATTTGG